MHFQLLVAIAGSTEPDDVDAMLSEAVNFYAEPEGAEEPGSGEWDFWVVGGRWRGAYNLTCDAVDRRSTGILRTPIETDFHIGGFPQRQLDHLTARDRLLEFGTILKIPTTSPSLMSPEQTDCARLRDIDTESLTVPFHWIDLNKRLHNLDYSDGRQSETGNYRFREWIKTNPPDTWLINVDVHR